MDFPAHLSATLWGVAGAPRPGPWPQLAPDPPERRDERVALVLVHGSLDRGDSFRRVIRRLQGWLVVSYDRRGYQGSRQAGPTGLEGHAGDLVALADYLAETTGSPPVAVGHSLGGDVAVAAALARPELFTAVGAWEPPMPWLHAAGAPGPGGTARQLGAPDDEAERFFCAMVGEGTWGRLSEAARRDRRLDGPALVADLASLRGPAPFDPAMLTVPAVFGRGGAASAERHRRTVDLLGEIVPGASVYRIDGAGHGAHLTHPEAFAGFARAAAAAGAEGAAGAAGAAAGTVGVAAAGAVGVAAAGAVGAGR